MQPDHPSSNASWSLIARAAAGDPAARSKFADTCLPVVRSFLDARWRTTPLSAEIEDAVQEVFVECLRAQGVLTRADPERGGVRGLLHGVACNVARRFEESAVQRRARTVGSESALDDVPAREASLSVQFDRAWALVMVRQAGELMRANAEKGSEEEKQRVELLQLRFAAGLPVRTIAEQWNQDPDAVHGAYRRAREEFRDCLLQVLSEHSLRPEEVRDEEVARILDLLG